MEIKKNRVAIEKIQKQSFLVDTAKQNYEYESYKFKVVGIGEEVLDQTLVGKTIVKAMQHGLGVELEGKEVIFIKEEDIIAVV